MDGVETAAALAVVETPAAVIRKTVDSQCRSPFFGSVSPWRVALRRLRRLPACIGLASVLLLALPHWAVAQASGVLVSNTGQYTSRTTHDLGDYDLHQGFRTEIDPDDPDADSGYTVTSVDIAFGAVSSPASVPAVSIWTAEILPNLGRKVGDLTPPASLSANSLNTWTSDGIELDPSANYAVVVDSAGTESSGNHVPRTDTSAEDTSSLTEWFFKAQYFRRASSRTGAMGWTVVPTYNGASLKMRISGRKNPAVPPELVSITRKRPSSSLTNADRLVWRVTFSKPVRNVDAADFSVVGTTATLAVSGQGSVYYVTPSGGDLASLEGTVTLGLASGQNIQDAGGRALVSTTPSGVNDNSYVLDNTGPRLLHIRRHDPAQEYTNARELIWRMTFTEPVVNLRTEDIALILGEGGHAFWTCLGGGKGDTASCGRWQAPPMFSRSFSTATQLPAHPS